jgi:uncharacterized membrane protein YkvI
MGDTVNLLGIAVTMLAAAGTLTTSFGIRRRRDM